ncbi:MAG: penicillin-binding protein 2, partial [Puniceicoccales bacterium]|nr:penicillin-binding protein 2 [Puniceicoccales bacterium]
IDRTRNFFDITAARRGNIYDRNGVALALTLPAVDLGVDPKRICTKTFDDDLKKVATFLQASEKELADTIAAKLKKAPHTRWIPLAENIPESTFQKIADAHLPGFYGNRKFLRTYPQKRRACHIIGFVNREGIACCGVEKFIDFFLRGQNGWVISEKDGRRQEMPQFRSRGIPCEDGCDAYLTVDIDIQNFVEDEMNRINELYHPTHVVILVSEAQTGKLLALACSPNYDPNAYGRVPLDFLRNRAIADCYEPGSVFKIVPVAAGLEEGIISTRTKFDCSRDTFVWQETTYHLPKDHSAFEAMTLADVLRKSSNRGSAQVAIRLGSERFFTYIRAFGFGERSGYGCDGEVEGILHAPSQWDGLTITRMPMGHAIGVTPLQMHMAMGVLASDGYLFTPRIVERMASANVSENDFNNVFSRTIIRRQVLSRRTVRQMRAMLFNPADGHVEHWTFASKTGTAQKIVSGRYVHDRHVASCSGFFPAQHPQFLVTVVVDSPETGGATGWGSTYAKPSFKRIAEALARKYPNLTP